MSWKTLLDAGLGFLRIAAALRGRFGSPYWRWRMETAVGPESRTPKPSPAAVRKAGVEYAAWVSRMSRL